jgi:hypothetical protein
METRRYIFRNSADVTSGIMIGGLEMTSKSRGRIIGSIELAWVSVLGYSNCFKSSLGKTFLKASEVLWGAGSMAIVIIAATMLPTQKLMATNCMFGCDSLKVYGRGEAPTPPSLTSIASFAPGWGGVVVGISDQSFAAWEVAIGDADNDGKNEILAGGCPDSKLDMYKYSDGIWCAKTLGSDFANFYPAITKNIKITDLNKDGQNEIVLGTGSDGEVDGREDDAKIHILKIDRNTIVKHIQNRTDNTGSTYTHNFGIYDIDGDGVKEILSSYCGSGEIYRWDIDSGLTNIQRTKIYQNSGSGEDAMITDIDNDGQQEFIESDCYRLDASYVRIFKFDASGTLIPYVTIKGYNGHQAFQCTSTCGDIDNDGQQELIIQWKQYENVSRQSIIAYKISGGVAIPICTIADEDPDLDAGFSENNCYWADADNDGTKELYISTRGEQLLQNGNGYARVLRFKINSINPLSIQKDIILDFNVGIAESCWINIGDADNDGLNEIAVATGKGARAVRGTSYMVVLKKNGITSI